MKKLLLKLNFFQKTILLLLLLAIVTVFISAISILKKIYMPNVIVRDHTSAYIYIPTGASIEDVCNILYKNNYIINRNSFEWMAERKKYSNHIKGGRYKLKNRMSNNNLLNLLRSGKQDPVRLTLNNIHTIEQLAGYIGTHLEADSISIAHLLRDNLFLSFFGYNRETSFAIFIPNTYEIFWNTNAENFVKRMIYENQKFWKGNREQSAKEIGLSPTGVMTLASIIDNESNMVSEYPAIAGVYINRLKRDMPLQADPTIKFIVGNFGLKRIIHKQTEIDSPYNTYKYKGLPPGPISMPSIKAINAVLNYEKHNYLYFCAKSDFSGYHAFAKTLVQHNQNAIAYQNALNKKRIYN
jgi:UPF0755 protein